MSNLLSAYFSRLWKDPIFWLALAFLMGDGIFMTMVQFIAPMVHRKHLCFRGFLL